MKNISVNLIVESMQKVTGKGPHQLHEPLFIGKEKDYLKNTINKNFVSSNGEYVNQFEKKIKEYTKAKFAIAVVNGTQAIYISLKACGVKKNEEVLVPALTFVGTVNAISYLGAIPHFVDSQIENFGIDCLKLKNYLNKIVKFKDDKCINKLTGKTIKAIVPVHVFGHPCDIQGIIKIAKKFNLIVVEDAAEALGSFYKKKHLGTFGDAGCVSFNGNKIITTGGGGMIITNKKVLAKTGFISRNADELRISKVEGCDVLQGVQGRLFGYGTLVFSGTGSQKVMFKMVPDPLSIKKQVDRVIN